MTLPDTTTPSATPSPTPCADISTNASLLQRLRRCRAILYDLDGTLVESAEIWHDLLQASTRAFGYPAIPREAWAATFGQSMEKNVELFLPGLEQQRFNDFCDDHYSDYLHHLHVLDGAHDMLTKSSARFAVGNLSAVGDAAAAATAPAAGIVIVTNCPRKITEIILRHSDFAKYFRYILCAGDAVAGASADAAASATSTSLSPSPTLLPKPSTHMIEHACALIGVSPQECMFIGDSKYDMMAANAAGCVSVGIGTRLGDIHTTSIRECIQILEYACSPPSSTA